MFGGLEVKGPDKKKEDASSVSKAAAPAASSSSAFSFMTSPSSPAHAEPAPSSGFSFLSSQPEPAKSRDSQDPAPNPTTSAFSFLSSPSRDESEAGGSPVAAPAAELAPPETVPATSSFGFLSNPTPTEPAAPTAPIADTVTGASPVTASGFGFLGGGASTHDTVSTMSRDSPVLSESGPSTDFFGAVNPHQPAGSGVVFGGGAAIGTKKPKKKRSRAAKVGVAANPATGAASAAVSAMTSPRPPTQSISIPEETTPTRHAAVDATRRAEEFMREKLQEESTAIQPATSQSSLPSFAPVQRDPSHDSDDDIMAAAKAAAEEAQNMNRRSLTDRMGLGNSLGGGLGGLFGRKNPSPPGAHMAAAASSNSRPPAPMMESTSASAALTPAERLQKEQEEVKRAMAERQLHMMQHTQPSSDSAETPAASNYEPVAVPSYAPNVISVMSVPAPRRPGAFAAPEPPRHIVVPKPKTATDIFQSMMTDFRSQVVVSMQRVSQLRQQRAALLEERFSATAKERLAVQQKAAAEAQQMTAAESEDFELADRMGAIIDGHERERAELATILKNIGRALKQLEQQKNHVVNAVTKCFASIQAKLKTFQAEQESKDSEDAAESLRRFSTTSRTMSAENERLQQDLKHIEKDETLVSEERKELEEAISEQSGTFEKLRDEAKTKLEEVDEEIEELRKQLAAKQAVAAGLRTEAAGHDEAVLRVRVKFARQLTRVQKKESTIRDNKEEWELEKTAYDRHHEAHESQVKTHSEALLARDQLLDALNKEVEMADTFESIVAKEIGFEAGTEAGELDDDLTLLQAEVVRCEAAVGEAKEILQVASSSLAGLEEEVKSLEFRIPELEEIKKTAATQRDFKAAGKASKEIKEATSRLKEVEEQLTSEAEERKAVSEVELGVLQVELQQKRTLANKKEKVSGLATMQRLADNVKRLIATKQSVCGNASENTIQGVGALVLDGQIKALRIEGQTYGDKFGGWTELMAEIGADDEVAETPAEQSVDAEEPVKEADTFREEVIAPPVESSPVEPEPQASKAEKMGAFRELTARLKELEDALEKAAANEEYEEAAELDDQLQQLLLDLGSLDLTEQDMDEALLEPVETVPSADLEADKQEEEATEVEEAPVEKEKTGAATEEEEPTEEEAPAEEVEAEAAEEEEEPAEEAEAEAAEEEEEPAEEEAPVEKEDLPADAADEAEEEVADVEKEEDSGDANSATEQTDQPLENGSEDNDTAVNGDEAVENNGDVELED